MKIKIVLPVFNDWEALKMLLTQTIEIYNREDYQFSYLAVDDCSSVPYLAENFKEFDLKEPEKRFGEKTGIDLEHERTGILPSTAWKRNYFKKPAQQKWFAGETISLGIGQGYNSFTPLQLAHAVATLANNGVALAR